MLAHDRVGGEAGRWWQVVVVGSGRVLCRLREGRGDSDEPRVSHRVVVLVEVTGAWGGCRLFREAWSLWVVSRLSAVLAEPLSAVVLWGHRSRVLEIVLVRRRQVGPTE